MRTKELSHLTYPPGRTGADERVEQVPSGEIKTNGCRIARRMFRRFSAYYLPATKEIIPADMATPSPDDRFHRCTYPSVGSNR